MAVVPLEHRFTQYIFGKPVKVYITPRMVPAGKLHLGAEFRLPDGNECTVSRLANRGEKSVEAICEPCGRARLFNIHEHVLYLGTRSPNYGNGHDRR